MVIEILTVPFLPNKITVSTVLKNIYIYIYLSSMNKETKPQFAKSRPKR